MVMKRFELKQKQVDKTLSYMKSSDSAISDNITVYFSF